MTFTEIKSRAFPYAIGLLVIALIYLFWITKKSGEEKASLEHRIEEGLIVEAHAKAENERIRQHVAQVYAEKRRDSITAVRRDSAANAKSMRLTATIRSLKAQRLDAGVVVDTFTVEIERDYDSLLQAKDVQISHLQIDKVSIETDLRDVISLEQEKTGVETTRADYWKQTAEEERKENRKLKRRLVVQKVVAGAVIVAVVVLAL